MNSQMKLDTVSTANSSSCKGSLKSLLKLLPQSFQRNTKKLQIQENTTTTKSAAVEPIEFTDYEIKIYTLCNNFKSLVEQTYRDHLSSQGICPNEDKNYPFCRVILEHDDNYGGYTFGAYFRDDTKWSITCLEGDDDGDSTMMDQSQANGEDEFKGTALISTASIQGQEKNDSELQTSAEIAQNWLEQAQERDTSKEHGTLTGSAETLSVESSRELFIETDEHTSTGIKRDWPITQKAWWDAILLMEESGANSPEVEDRNEVEFEGERSLCLAVEGFEHALEDSQDGADVSHDTDTTGELVGNIINDTNLEMTDPRNSDPSSSDNIPTSPSSSTTLESPTDLPSLQHPLINHFLQKLLVQNPLKHHTNLSSIPTIHDYNFRPYLQNGLLKVQGLNYIIEEDSPGVPIRLSRSSKCGGTDKIEMFVGGKWVDLSGRKKERFLDDLARIQVAYSTIMSSDLGPVKFQFTTIPREGFFPCVQLDDTTFITADVIPSISSPEEYLQTLHRLIPSRSFLKYLLRTETPPTLNSGPYPLQPITPLWSHLFINPSSGKITFLSNCHEMQSVPWEIASFPSSSIQLSSNSKQRYIYSLKRHFWGYLIQQKTSTDSGKLGLYELAFSHKLIGVECLLRSQQQPELSPEEIEGLEKYIVKSSTRRSYKKDKKLWELNCNSDYIV